MLTVVYALCCLMFAGVNDLVFKRYGRKARSVGLLLTLIGVIWSLFFAALGFAKGTLVFNGPTLLIGVLSGAASALANILLIEGMKRTGAGIGATIYRLNLVFVAVMAFFFLGETFTPWKTLGLALAIATIVLLFKDSRTVPTQTPATACLMMLVAASFLRACMGLGYKVASLHGISDDSFLLLNGLCWVVGGEWYRLGRERSLSATQPVFIYSLVSGLLVCGIVFFMKQAVNHGDASVAITISQLSFIVTFPASVVLFKEPCSWTKVTAIVLAVICVLCLAMGQHA